MKEGRVGTESKAESETSLTLNDRFHPYKKQASSPPRYNSHRRTTERYLLMNNQRVFASIGSDESLLFECSKKAEIHNNSPTTIIEDHTTRERHVEPIIPEEDISMDIKKVGSEEDFEFLDNVDFSDCFDLELFDFDQSFSINKASPVDGVSKSYESPEILKPRSKEPSLIEWSDDFTPKSPNSNRETSTLELLLEQPLQRILYDNVNTKN